MIPFVRFGSGAADESFVGVVDSGTQHYHQDDHNWELAYNLDVEGGALSVGNDDAEAIGEDDHCWCYCCCYEKTMAFVFACGNADYDNAIEVDDEQWYDLGGYDVVEQHALPPGVILLPLLQSLCRFSLVYCKLILIYIMTALTLGEIVIV